MKVSTQKKTLQVHESNDSLFQVTSEPNLNENFQNYFVKNQHGVISQYLLTKTDQDEVVDDRTSRRCGKWASLWQLTFVCSRQWWPSIG